MQKKSITKNVSLDSIYSDPTFQKVAQYVQTQNFFAKTIGKFGHYTNLPVYQKDNKYYLLGFKSTIDSLDELGCEEVLVDVINLSDKDIIEFLLRYQYQEHHEERCMAELMKICQEFTIKPEGKEWLKTLTGSRDKQKQYSVLFDISEYGAKCYLKLIQKGNERFLELLSDKKNGGLTKAYTECCKAEKDSEESSASEDASEKSNNAASSQNPAESQEEGEPNRNSVPNAAPRVASGSEDEISNGEEVFLDHLAKYSREEAPNNDTEPEQKFAVKVLVLLHDGTQLELAGKIDLVVDGISIRSTEQLTKRTDDTWILPEHHSPVSLMVYPEDDDFFSDF